MQEEKPIGAGLAITLIVLGVLIDLLQGLLDLAVAGVLLDTAVDIVAAFFFTLLLHHHDHRLLSRRKFSVTATAVAEFIPILNVLPFWTINAVYIVVMDKVKHYRKRDTVRPPNRRWRV